MLDTTGAIMPPEWCALGALKKPQCGASVLETDSPSIHTTGGRKNAGPDLHPNFLAAGKIQSPGPLGKIAHRGKHLVRARHPRGTHPLSVIFEIGLPAQGWASRSFSNPACAMASRVPRKRDARLASQPVRPPALNRPSPTHSPAASHQGTVESRST